MCPVEKKVRQGEEKQIALQCKTAKCAVVPSMAHIKRKKESDVRAVSRLWQVTRLKNWMPKLNE